jgi:uncharacterized membrane protein SpoIIM required for sporulation
MIAGFVTGFILYTPQESSQSATDVSEPYLFDNPNVLTLTANNVFVAAILISGGVSLGTFSVSGDIFNGFSIGIITRGLLASGLTPTGVAVSILTHGFIEIPALLLSAALGLSHAAATWRYLLGRREQPVTVRELQTTSQLFILSVVGLLLGAVIELHVTPKLL